jgi:hypothetical protein
MEFNECEENDFDAILADIQKEMNMGDIVKELGYGCTVDVSQCKEVLSLFLPLTDNMLSKLLGAIAHTHAGLEDNQNTFLTFGAALGYNNLSELPPLNSWNIDVLIDTVKNIVSCLKLNVAILFQSFISLIGIGINEVNTFFFPCFIISHTGTTNQLGSGY